MHHVAIMKPSWKLTEKVLSGEKGIESRWYKNKVAPWNRITAGDIVFFKNSGEPITIKTEVEKVMQFSDLTSSTVQEILDTYGSIDGIEQRLIPSFFELFKDKRYCVLVFLKNAQALEKPFHVRKKGFGMQAAWMVVEDINSIRV